MELHAPRMRPLKPLGKALLVEGSGRRPSPHTLALRYVLELDKRQGRRRTLDYYVNWYRQRTGVRRAPALQTVRREAARIVGPGLARGAGAPALGRPPSPAVAALREKLEKSPAIDLQSLMVWQVRAGLALSRPTVRREWRRSQTGNRSS